MATYQRVKKLSVSAAMYFVYAVAAVVGFALAFMTPQKSGIVHFTIGGSVHADAPAAGGGGGGGGDASGCATGSEGSTAGSGGGTSCGGTGGTGGTGTG